MILFVFEGEKGEHTIFDSIEKLFLSSEELRVVKCGFDLPTLYSNLKKTGEDLFRSLPLKENGIIIPEGKRSDTLFSQIFLFFDYDFQNRMGVQRLNQILDEMLEFFNDETDNGKLYINYPMVESLKYTKELPDGQYYEYVATRQECVEHKFKENAELFAYAMAKGYRFIDLSKIDRSDVLSNWENLKLQNVMKANFLLTGNNEMPKGKDVINQTVIFDAQKTNYVDKTKSVAILNSFPLFLYEYLK
jgi:hypothetical protein